MDETGLPTAAVARAVHPPAPGHPAEAGHHDYYVNNSDQPYCQYVVAPKIVKFRSRFGAPRAPGGRG